MTYQASRNKIAWEHQAYRFWVQSTGTPDQVARDMLDDPGRWLRRHLHLLGDVKDRRVLHPLGSNGRKGIPLAILGAEVTIIDFSEENKRYALEEADVALARRLHEQYPALQARDLCHLASCRRRGVKEIKTFDQTLAAISGNP